MLGGKPALERHRGKRVFNGGDFAMLNYTLDDNEYPSASFLVVADGHRGPGIYFMPSTNTVRRSRVTPKSSSPPRPSATREWAMPSPPQ